MAKRYSCTTVKGLWKRLKGKYVEWRWNKKWRERKKAPFKYQGLELPCLMQKVDLKSLEFFSLFWRTLHFYESGKDNSTLNPSKKCHSREKKHPTSLLSAADHPQWKALYTGQGQYWFAPLVCEQIGNFYKMERIWCHSCRLFACPPTATPKS